MIGTTAPALSLADLEAFDPRAPQRAGANASRERRFLCPLCGDGKPKDAAHRSLCASTQNGAWNCKRCGASGKLRDFWQERPALDAKDFQRTRARAALSRAFEVPAASRISSGGEAEEGEFTDWRRYLCESRPLDSTPGAKYLAGRGITLEVAAACGVRFVANWRGRPAVVFPLCARDGAAVAVQGRCVDGRGGVDKPAAGPKKRGAFFAVWSAASGRIFGPLDEAVPAVILCEAPIDALSLAAAGYPALALCGTTSPAWLHQACAFRRVLLAFDADTAGDAAALQLAPDLASFGARCERLRPEGAKDWNELLQVGGCDALADVLAVRVLLDAQL